MNKNIFDKKAAVQLACFLILMLTVFFIMLKGKDIKSIWQTVRGASFAPLAAGLFCAVIFPISEAFNVRMILDRFGYKISRGQALKYACTGFFFSSVTPSSTGGQPVQLYVMKRDGIALSHSTLALLMELASFQIAAFLLEILAIIFAVGTGLSLPVFIWILGVLGLIINLLFIILVLSCIFSEKMEKRILKLMRWLILKIPLIHANKKQEYCEKAGLTLAEFHDCSVLIKQYPKLFLKVFLVSLLQVICWFSIPYAVFISMGGGMKVSYIQILVMQTFLYMSSALLPLPGAVGISELAFARIFGSIYTKQNITSAILLDRGISFYFLLILSGIAMFLFTVSMKERIKYENRKGNNK